MSLVEKALKKLQSATPAAPDSGTAVRRPGLDSLPELGKAAASFAAHSQPLPVAAPGHRTDKVVSLNPQALRAAGLLPPEQERRRLEAEYRQIKRPLIAAARGRGRPALPNGRAIMIASALPGEGKTFTSVNLALSMALEKDTTVLLVDGDLAKSHVSRAFGIREEPGLMDLLTDETRDAASVILPTTIRGLSLMPAGRDCVTATELLASARMERVVAELLERDPSRIVLFDSPPLLLTTESRALTIVAGQVVVVVRAEETAHKAVLDSLSHVGPDKPLGLILNQCETRRSEPYYGYGEYGQYGNTASERE